MIAWISRLLYALAELLDAFVLFSDKFNNSLSYRRSWRHYLQSSTSITQDKSLWIHGVSVGELEDLAGFFLNNKDLQASGFDFSRLAITSSSVSAKNRLIDWGKSYQLKYAGPIPQESQSNCREFLEKINPEIMVMSHSDIWPTLLNEIEKKSIKVLWLPTSDKDLGWIRSDCLGPVLTAIGTRHKDHVFSFDVPQNFIGITRLDRIHERIKKASSVTSHVLENENYAPQAGKVNLLLASCWKEDARFMAQALGQLSPAVQEALHIVCIPHDPENSHEIAQIKRALPSIKLVLTEGKLLESYRNQDLAFVGGGFRTGLHNVLEPALWGLPVVCGPKLEKQPEAHLLIQQQQLFSFSSSYHFAEFLKNFVLNKTLREVHKERARGSQKLLENDLGANIRLIQAIKLLSKNRKESS